MCQYCGQAVSAELLRTAVPCPRAECRTLNVWGATRCLRCTSWIVVQCIFCGGLSPYNRSECLSCREPFYGAPQRKAARDAEIARQHGLETARGAGGGVAAPLLGVMAGGAIGAWAGAHWGQGHSHEPSGYGSSGDEGSGGYGAYDPNLDDGTGGVPVGTPGAEVGGASDDGSFGGITESSDDGGSSFDGGSSDAGGSDFGGSSDGGGGD
jgi:hypothetical protein